MGGNRGATLGAKPLGAERRSEVGIQNSDIAEISTEVDVHAIDVPQSLG